ncbi:aminodeoxychorismate synthase component I [Nocardia macrotermitis]|uniref:aminodeoxychorismate synthase n=1 Tax=Nocardia macrotermitis TaxID=2585198 RepID=A0A7K0D4S0_9NOCA|nr:aminodeoxychorismate synthase component I [Nocardia macrotermitis]MQY20561.1 Isochorismate synthase MenF [Nocardia macrotermitis]
MRTTRPGVRPGPAYATTDDATPATATHDFEPKAGSGPGDSTTTDSATTSRIPDKVTGRSAETSGEPTTHTSQATTDTAAFSADTSDHLAPHQNSVPAAPTISGHIPDNAADRSAGVHDEPTTRAHRAALRTAKVSTDATGPHAGVSEGCREAGVALTVLWERVERAVDAEAVFLALYRESVTAFWLDSTHAEPGLDRFSYLGDAGGPLAETVRYRVGAGLVEVAGRGGCEVVGGDVFDYLAMRLGRVEVELPDVPFDFVGGYVGYLGYEMKAECGAAERYRAEMPDAQWVFADRVVVVDHVAEHTYLVALADSDTVAAAEDWLSSTRAVLAGLPDRCTPDRLELAVDEGAVESRLTRGRQRYLADIAEIQAQLRAGETYEVNLTDSAYVDQDCDGLAVYRALRRSNPAPYAAFLRFGELEVACSSPERFLTVDRSGMVETKPIKGTAPRGATPEEDEILRRALESDPKTRAENLMIVDLLRNDLGRVCELGSVRVTALMHTETYTTMHQLVTTIRGRLRPDVDAVTCLRACFPGGSMTGAPKLRTMEIIDELETEARGIYSGTIGFLGLGGTADLNVVIRTAVRYGGRWRVGAGGAIVLDSDAEQEYHEMVLKATTALRAVTAVAGAHSRS